MIRPDRRGVRHLLACAVASGVIGACAPGARLAKAVDRVGEVGPESFVGTVRVVGSEPFPNTIVQAEDGRSLIALGVLRDDIRRLSGARVRITGHLRQGEQPAAALDVSSWEVVSVDGERPLVGRLEGEAEQFRLVRPGGAEVPLNFVSGPLAEGVGSLVWILLDERGGVAGYGIIREPDGGPSG
ncbi:hypothetical protein [Candidatus Palauibacter sp.]|uniref:hypothetical protein n=1 Tax=Candidatus Palauibacter sp. TaxID=3101350 RepID=UPI003B01FAC7